MHKKDEIKLCFAASSGGHYEQLMMLKPLMQKYASFIVTEKTKYVSETELKQYYMHLVNRKELLFIPKCLGNVIRSLCILVKERPNVVICTGVLAMVPLCIIAKALGCKLVYIESFAKITSPTISGNTLYKYTDLFFIQWEQMREFYPNAIYRGGIY